MEKRTFEGDLREKLESLGVGGRDVDYILSLIRSSRLDENQKIMDNDVYEKLNRRGLEDVFKKACEDLSFNFTHSNEPEV